MNQIPGVSEYVDVLLNDESFLFEGEKVKVKRIDKLPFAQHPEHHTISLSNGYKIIIYKDK